MYDKRYIRHYGVKGMKWGVRKSDTSSSRLTSRKKLRSMSDADIKKRIERMNLEKRYKDLDRELNSSKTAQIFSTIWKSSVTGVGITQTSAALTAAIVAAKTLYSQKVG